MLFEHAGGEHPYREAHSEVSICIAAAVVLVGRELFVEKAYSVKTTSIEGHQLIVYVKFKGEP